jgi:hypothetical protein
MRGVLAAALLAGLALPAAAPAAKPKPGHTKAGQAAARAALLTTKDVAAGWTATAAPKQVPSLGCSAAAPSVAGIRELGSAASASLRATANGPFVSQTAYVFATPVQAATVFRRVTGKVAERCLAESVKAGSTTDVQLAVAKTESLRGPALAGRTALVRATGTASSIGQRLATYVDLVLVARGRAVTALTFVSFEEPAAASLELRLGRIVAARLARA